MYVESVAEGIAALVGRDISEIIRQWGYPTSKQELPNGHMVYAFETRKTQTQSFFGPLGGFIIGSSTTSERWTAIYLEADDSGTIVFTRVEGNDWSEKEKKGYYTTRWLYEKKVKQKPNP